MKKTRLFKKKLKYFLISLQIIAKYINTKYNSCMNFNRMLLLIYPYLIDSTSESIKSSDGISIVAAHALHTFELFLQFLQTGIPQ